MEARDRRRAEDCCGHFWELFQSIFRQGAFGYRMKISESAVVGRAGEKKGCDECPAWVKMNDEVFLSIWGTPNVDARHEPINVSFVISCHCLLFYY